jgi:chemotaxis protein histidine kinase CheA
MNKRIVNQGIPVSQIEAVTHQPVMSIKPKVYDSVESNKVDRHHGQPDIIQLPLAGATHAEIHQTEELARRLDGKNEDGTRTELPLAESGLSGHHEPRVAGRLKDTVAHVQGPYVPVESASLPAADAIAQELPLAMRPEKKLSGLELDAQTIGSKRIDDPQGLGVLDKKQASLPISPSIATVSTPIENIQTPLLVNSPEVDKTVLMPANKSPIITPQQALDGQPMEQLQREVQQGQQQEMAGQQALQAQQQVEQQAQQAEQVQREVQQRQQQEMASQQALQAQQQVEQQAEQAEQVQREVQQRQQQEMASQQALQAQQQAQQAEQAERQSQQRQQQEMASQQASQAQQQAQQAEQEQRQAKQRQQQEMASQQTIQAQPK